MRRAVLVIALLLLVFVSVTWVPGSDVAVRESLGGERAALSPGLHLRLPLYHRVYVYDTSPVVIDEPVPIVTRDNATFRLPCRVGVSVSRGDVLTFHKGRSGRDTATYLRETVRAAIAAAVKTLSSDQILAPGPKTVLAQSVSADLLAHGISDDGLAVGSPGPQVLFNAVVDFLRRQLPASAQKLAASTLEASPKEALAHAAMGAVLESEGRRDEAEAQYMEALYLDPTAPEPMSRLFLLNQTSRDPEALGRLQRLLEASIEKKKDSAVHHDWLGQVYMREGRDDKAEMAFKTAIGLAPKTPEFHVSLGGLRVKQKKFDEARAAYNDALALRPGFPLALFNVGVTYAMQGNLDKAIESFEAAEKSAPPSVALLNSLAQAYEAKGETARAVETLKRSLQERPDQPARAADLKRLQSSLKTR